jgi:formiminoglutamate deiminase
MYRFLGSLTPDDIEVIAAAAMVEMLEGGFTALAEFHYVHHDIDGKSYDNPAELSARIAGAARETGIGLTLLPVLYSHGGFGGTAPTGGQIRFINDISGYAKLFERAKDAITHLDDAAIGIAPHSLRAVSPEALNELLAIAPSGPVHIHVAEQVKEVEDCLAWSGQRPVDWLLDHAPIDERWCLVHATHLTPEETQRFARSGAVAGLCPITEANLGDGIFNGVDFLGAGGAYGVGSDSNIELSAPGELKQLEYSQRLKHKARNVLAGNEGESTGRVLYEGALAGGTRAVGRRVGAIDTGYRADFVILDPKHPHVSTVSGDRWLDCYVFTAGTAAIDSVIVSGQTVVSKGRHHSRDAIMEQYAATMRRILG